MTQQRNIDGPVDLAETSGPEVRSRGSSAEARGCPRQRERLATAEDSRQADPPLLTGGSLQSDNVGNLISVGVDFLTVTVGAANATPDSVGTYLCDATRFLEEGKPLLGFARSELRQCLGGECWRRMEPHQSSKDFGLDYESWEASGEAALGLAFDLRGRGKVRPSHIDIAFDFSVKDAMTADVFWHLVEPWSRRKGFKPGISGEDDVNTRYIGGKTSEKRIRIYRKDKQDAGFAEFFGTVLRVELILKGDHARRWWRLYDRDEDAAKRAAGTIIHGMTGFRPVEGSEALPELEKPAGLADAQQLALFIEQHGARLLAYDAAGVDVLELARTAGVTRRNRMAESRFRKRVRSLLAAGAAQVVAMARLLLARDLGASEAA